MGGCGVSGGAVASQFSQHPPARKVIRRIDTAPTLRIDAFKIYFEMQAAL